jgi:hypothetical protein
MKIYNQKKDLWLMAWADWNPAKRYTEEYQVRAETTNYYKPEVLQIRDSFVRSKCDLKTAFDYGCGMRPFHLNLKTKESDCLGMWDKYIEPHTKFDREAYMKSITLLLFDVLEHMHDPHAFLMTIPQKRLIMTIPVFPAATINTLEELEGWKHTRPGEHFIYATEAGIIDIVTESGWNIEYKGYPECPPREDILTLVLTRN